MYIILYIQVKSLRLVGIFLLVYIQSKHMAHVKEVEAESVPTGIMGMVVSWVTDKRSLLGRGQLIAPFSWANDVQSSWLFVQ